MLGLCCGFNLRKFTSNNVDLLKIIPNELRIIIKMNNKPATQQRLLAALSSMYDPLGSGAPFFLIIQILCKKNLKWGDPIDDEINREWLKWRNNLMTLQCKCSPRCMKPKDFGKVTNCTFHHFSDASKSGYGQCSYIRLVNERAQIHCCLLIGSSS